MDNEVGPDQLVALLDARGASALQVTRKAQICKDTAVALNKVAPLLLMHRHSVSALLALSMSKSPFLAQNPFQSSVVPPNKVSNLPAWTSTCHKGGRSERPVCQPYKP